MKRIENTHCIERERELVRLYTLSWTHKREEGGGCTTTIQLCGKLARLVTKEAGELQELYSYSCYIIQSVCVCWVFEENKKIGMKEIIYI